MSDVVEGGSEKADLAAGEAGASLVNQILAHPAVRLALLGPTVLTAISSLSDLGAIARWIADAWLPVMRRLSEIFTIQLPPPWGDIGLFVWLCQLKCTDR
jgi:hypothetical protein